MILSLSDRLKILNFKNINLYRMFSLYINYNVFTLFIFCFFSFSLLPSYFFHISQEAEVYSVSSGSWRQLDPQVARVPYGIHTQSRVTMYLDGNFFWCATPLPLDNNEDEKIVRFDFAREVFKSTSFPDASVIGDYSSWKTTLTALNGSVVF